MVNVHSNAPRASTNLGDQALEQANESLARRAQPGVVDLPPLHGPLHA
jgi:hypothetical protein